LIPKIDLAEGSDLANITHDPLLLYLSKEEEKIEKTKAVFDSLDNAPAKN
jgi:hypothetical protein